MDSHTWVLKYKDASSGNLLDPQKVVQGFHWAGNAPVLNALESFVVIPVNPSQTYWANVLALTRAQFYDSNNEPISEVGNGTPIASVTSPAGAATARISFLSSFDPEAFSIVEGSSVFEAFYVSRQVYPVYGKMSRRFKMQGGEQYYTEELDGQMALVREDFDYLMGVPKTDTLYMVGQTDAGEIRGHFVFTDAEIDEDGRKATFRLTADDAYEDIEGAMEKVHNLIDIGATLEELDMRRRSIVQVYIAGDSVVTNILMGSYWEQKIQIEPEFDDATLKNTYYFANPLNLRNIPASYAPSLSTDVTGDYDANRENVPKGYKLVEDAVFKQGYIQRTWYIVPIAAVEGAGWQFSALYQTVPSRYSRASLNVALFTGVNGETGEFYFAEYRIYVRHYTGKVEIDGIETYKIPASDIVTRNDNYTHVLGYNLDNFLVYDEFQVQPNGFGRVPEGAPDAGKYYKELGFSPASGLSNPTPVSSTNWKAVSLWYYDDATTKYNNTIDGDDITIRDTMTLDSTIQALLVANGVNLVFVADPACSEFLYNTTNPLGAFTYLDFDQAGLVGTTDGNLEWLLTPKSNAILGNYDEPASIAEISLSAVLKMLRACFNLYWHIEGSKLRIEHIKWYQNGGTYTGTNVGADLTTSVQPMNGKSWDFAQGKWSYDKADMFDRIEFHWMDVVGAGFEGLPVDIVGGFVSKGNVDDRTASLFTTDVDFMGANQSEVAKTGFCMFGAVIHDGRYRVPFVEVFTATKELVLQNGFMSFEYLRKYALFALPSDEIVVGGEGQTVLGNISRYRRQEAVYPSQGASLYALVKTSLGEGKLDSLEIDLSSNMAKANIMHNTNI